MKLKINIEYNSGEQATYIAQTSEFVKWEKKTGLSIKDWEEKSGITDLMFLAYEVYRKELVGKQYKPFEAWIETVNEWDVERVSSPKVMNPDLSEG